MKICKHIVMPPTAGFRFLDELSKKLVEVNCVAWILLHFDDVEQSSTNEVIICFRHSSWLSSDPL